MTHDHASSDIELVPESPEHKKDLHRAAWACSLGSALEYYDFALYTLAAALIFGPLFFPEQTRAMSLIASFGTYFLAVRAARREHRTGTVTFGATAVTALCLGVIAFAFEPKLLPSSLAGAATLALPALVAYAWSAPYRRARILSFLNPEADIQGTGYQAYQSLIAVGTGGQGFDPEVGPRENLRRFLVMELVTGLGWNAGRAITNVVLITLLGPPVLRVLRRAARRARFE